MPLMTRTDVTAVKFFDNYVLAGIGSQVNVFDKNSGSFLCKKEVLTGQKIYGFVISKCRQRILVFGGKKFTVVKVKVECLDTDMLERCFEPVVCNDWLLSCLWCGDTIALLTAHNVVQKWDVSSQTLVSEHASKDNSILYSGLLVPLCEDVLVMAGTVFSESIIHKCGDKVPLHRLRGHKGVIFSISCEPDKNLIVTTSDDRSVRIWSPKTIPMLPSNSLDYWQNIDIVCKYELYGHQARVMRNCITNSYVVSVGEDSVICIWDFEGKLLKKNTAHQNGCIWAVDYSDNLLVTGGGDSGVILHPLATNKHYCESQIINIDVGMPKRVLLTARRNVVILNDEDDLMYYIIDSKKTTAYKLSHESTYKLLSLSSCKQMVAVADMNGKFDVFAESCKNEPVLVNLIDTKLHLGKILSMHWAGNRHLVLCSEDGNINVLAYNNNTELYASFSLPACKERWLTSAAVDMKANIFVLGDRCGNINVYVKGKRDPIKTFIKVHGRYGPTSITIKNNHVVTTGRDGAIKYFHVDSISNQFNYMNRKDLEFPWVEKFLDKDDNLICGFQERVFVVYNMRDSCKVLEVACGGGHRSWDAQRCIIKTKDKFEPIIQLVYVKNSDINLQTYFLNKLMSRNLIKGSHSKEINCLKVYKDSQDNTKSFYISGGEDTTLRISSADIRHDMNITFRDEVVFKHLSSVRTLKLVPTIPNGLLVISGGGRAQINIKNVQFIKNADEIEVESQELVEYLVKGTDKERKGNQSWKNCTVDFDPETRIMDIDVIKDNEDLFIFAGCSDAVLRIFSFNNTFKTITESKYHKTCILKTHCFRFLDKDILATATTRGNVAFWLIDDLHSKDNWEPFFIVKTRESGVNSIATKVFDNNILLATGGDDNSILLHFLKPNQGELTSLAIESTWSSSNYHSSQITGILIVEDLLLSTSIDQRITLFKWNIENGIDCEYKTQMYSNVADIQGMDVLDVSSDSIKVCVFGKGLEVVSIPKHSN
ncbi:hypothetical protein O3G_MSEX008412 [Manduca sexta]|uniref:tRNA (34-2'-O)-methyltransferase regulator WDR6 n=1 Tax=Manduca sexta TaxID=7130 RepID=A0A921ZBM6_MANSE|nr:hypothetical protein O3G_MSEX008412 [Manduca sexta]